MKYKFTGNVKLVVRWNRKEAIPEMERKLRELFWEFGLEFTGSGSDLILEERSLTFQPPVRPL